MENANTFEPLWTDDKLIDEDEGYALEDVHRRIMEILMAKPTFRNNHLLGLDDIIYECFNTFETLLWDEKVGNDLVDRLRETSAPFQQDPVFMIAVAMDKWYQSAASIFNRDPNHGLPSQGMDETLANRVLNPDEDLETVGPQDRLGNIGLLGILMTMDSWATPSNSTLKAACLIANAASTILSVTSLLIPAIPVEALSPITDTNHCMAGLRLLLQTTWRLAREGPSHSQHLPGQEFGATSEEIKLSHDGRRLLSSIGVSKWKEAPYWHPCRVSPGSPWGKFIRNYLKPVFAEHKDGQRRRLLYRLPSSALALAGPFETYYSDLRTRFDQVNKDRVILSQEELRSQYTRLAEATGQVYSTEKPSREVSLKNDDISFEIQNILPLAKKPITDNAGTLTVPFISTAARAFRFENEPDDIDLGLSIMTLGV